MTDNLQTMNLFAKKPGKSATKGQKEIYDANRETITFYTRLATSLTILNGISTYLLSKFNLFWTIFAIFMYFISISAMKYMARPVFAGEHVTKNIVDGGIDLNMKSGFAEYLKDIIIATVICQALAIYSVYLWWLWSFVPMFFIYTVWVSFIWPWIHQSPSGAEENEVSDKKKKKMERKMMRNHR